MKPFKAFLVSLTEDGFKHEIIQKTTEDLPEGDVLIEVHYSSLNYKDALVSSGVRGIARSYPHTPGIDVAGIVVESKDDTFQVGEAVIVTGYDLGVNHSGGYQSYVRVPKEWVVKCPENLSLREAMIYGTAGFTAALSVYKLIQGIKPEMGDILVTGASGGVGSVALSILAKLGYQVTAATGKLTEEKMLKELGAKEVIYRESINDQTNKPLLKSRFKGVIDTVGGNILATALKSTEYDGVVTACGNVMSNEFKTTVLPFILKGVSLLGVDSVFCPRDLREKVWVLLANEWKLSHLEDLAHEISMNELSAHVDSILKGQLKGRTIVNLKL
jgi:acrylyl-CoA reductase (NADPH)